MSEANTGNELLELLKVNLPESDLKWLDDNLSQITHTRDTTKLYLTYSLMAGKVKTEPPRMEETSGSLQNYLQEQDVQTLQLARIYLLVRVLEEDFSFFSPKVAQIIQVADQSELITFLKYLILLPGADYFKNAAVDSLRTNITPVFEAITMNNPYPAAHFNDQQWNQMYLKAAFMQLNLENIQEVEQRANEELARIISDYAHERWAASRDIDPMIWRPVTRFLNDPLLKDMSRLLQSDDPAENKAAALCCYQSRYAPARALLLSAHPELVTAIKNKSLQWNNIKA